MTYSQFIISQYDSKNNYFVEKLSEFFINNWGSGVSAVGIL